MMCCLTHLYLLIIGHYKSELDRSQGFPIVGGGGDLDKIMILNYTSVSAELTLYLTHPITSLAQITSSLRHSLTHKYINIYLDCINLFILFFSISYKDFT